MKLARYIGMVCLAILLLGVAVPFIDAGVYRERIQEALERALNRKVTAGKVRFNLLTGPGFTVEDVTIAEDSAIGIEPIAYVPSLNARVRLTTLWASQLSLSNLRLTDPTLNLSKSDKGVWNFQSLLRDASARAATRHEFPSVQVRNGRINFKFGDYKTIFYLSDSDLDVTPLAADRLDIRFSGQPARTDQGAQTFGRLLGRGQWNRGTDGKAHLDANIELERSGVSDLARLMEGHAIELHGVVASRAHIAGPIDQLKFSGQLRLEDIHRSDLVPSRGSWDFKYRGTADLVAQRIEMQTVREPERGISFIVRLRASDYLFDPKWAAILDITNAPVGGFLDVARHMGAPLPEGLSADGTVAGLIGYSRPGGVQGRLEVHNSSIRLQKAAPLDISSAMLVVDGNTVHIGPSAVALADGQTADLQGSYDSTTGAVNVTIETANMNVAELRTGSGRLLEAGGIPVLEACKQGTWRGKVSYSRQHDEGVWSGAFELRAARLDLDGLRDPVRIASATVEVEGPKIAMTQIKGRVGKISFTGDYRHEIGPRPDRMRLDIPEADGAELERLLLPSPHRDSGFLERFRFRKPSIPEWLESRRLEANLRVRRLTMADETWSVDKLRLVQDGPWVRLTGIEARQEEARASGSITIDLARGIPTYRVEGKMDDVPYRDGTVSFEGSGETSGTANQLLLNASATGTFSGDEITLSPEAVFNAISGNFELTPGVRVRLTGLQATQGLESYTGQGVTQADGKMLLELTSGKRQVRVAVAR